jgi:hypothetical protein
MLAEAIWKYHSGQPLHPEVFGDSVRYMCGLERAPEALKAEAYAYADAALAALRTWLKDHELVVVPREATEEMIAHASLVEVDDIELTPSEYRAAWQAMITAAPVTGLE